MINNANLNEYTKDYIVPSFEYLGLPGSHDNINHEMASRLIEYIRPEGVSLTPDELRFYAFTIENLLEKEKNVKVCEHGAGASTLYLAFLLNLQRPYSYESKILSLETSLLWAAMINLFIEKMGILNVGLILNHGRTPWREILSSRNEKYNVVMIDGRGRAEFAKAMIDFIDDNALIFLHDYSPNLSRDEEFQYLKSKFKIFGIVDSLVCFQGKIDV